MSIIKEIDTSSEEQVKRFVTIPYRLYETQTNWVPPIFENIALYLNRKVHPIHQVYDVVFFIATRNGQDIGRIMVMVKHNAQQEETAQFALFECENDPETAKSLFVASMNWVQQKGLKRISGPHRLDFSEGDGILISGFEYSQIMNMTPYHHSYYAQLLNDCGFEKELDFTSSHIHTSSFHLPEWLETLARHLEQKEELEVKHFSSLEELSQYIPAILQTLQKSLQQNRDLNTANEAQVAFSLQQLMKLGLQPRLIKAILRKSEMVSVILGFPDFSDVLRKYNGNFHPEAFREVVENPTGLVINGFGVVSEFQMRGINALLFREMANMVRDSNIQKVSIVQTTDSNKKMQAELNSLGIPTTQVHRRYFRYIAEELFNYESPNDIPSKSFHRQSNMPFTLIDAIQSRSIELQKQKYIFLSGNNEETVSNFATINYHAKNIAVQLQKYQGKNVLLLYPPGLDFIQAFLACMYANVVAVPCYPVSQSTKKRCLTIVQSARPEIIISDRASKDIAIQRIEDLSEYNWLVTDEIKETSNWEVAPCDPNSIAMIQYTSGSTMEPRGVVLTHHNLIQNVDLIKRCFGLTPDKPGLSWLPPYHDMGLIGGILISFYVGMDSIFMLPLSFLRKPVRWLEAISKYKIYVSGAPNFSYDFCVDKITEQQCENLDLRSWSVAFNGAEPIRKGTMDRFCDKFTRYGFDREAFYPCYGLAESTLIVSTRQPLNPICLHEVNDDSTQQKKTIVSCGNIVENTLLYIVNPETFEICEPEKIGEIWLSSPSIAQGYWQDLQNTEKTFGQSLRGISGTFMRTGDLGFLKDGELFVCGRIKNLIIIRGKNYHPHDLETVVMQSHIAIETSSVAAFSIEIREESQIVIVVELKRQQQKADIKEIASAIRGAISVNFQLEIYAVLVVKPGQIPKTTSGKIQHHLCRSAFLNDTLAIINKDIRAFVDDEQIDPDKFASLEKDLRIQLAKLLRVGENVIDLDQPAADLGLSSLTAVSLISYVEEKYDFEIPIELFFEKTTLRELMVLILSPVKKNDTI